MLIIENKNIEITRGNILPLTISAKNKDDTDYNFTSGDVIRFNIMKNKNCKCVVLQKDFEITENCTQVNIDISAEDMKIGNPSSKSVDYWYEVELNPNGETQTIIGITKVDGKDVHPIITILPEGGE